MNPPLKRVILIIIGCAAAATLGVGVLLGIIGEPPRADTEPTARARIIQLPPTETPSATPVATPTPAPTPGPSVRLALTSFDRQPSLGGVTATIVIENHRSSPLTFSFDPSYDVRLVDARGTSWPLRWAAYNGSVTLAPGKSVQLTQAFFAGPVAASTSWPLTVTVERAPGVGRVSWKIPEHGAATTSVDRLAAQIPTVVASGPVALSLSDPLPSSALGGIQVDLMIQNKRSTDLVFRFDPTAQLSAEDNLKRPYRVRWAQYDGVVHVGPHATERLARVFFEGPITDAAATWLTVSLRQVPGVQTLQSNVPLY